MRRQMSAMAVALGMAFAMQAGAQTATTTKVVEAEPMEGVVTVSEVDHANRTVTIKGPNGDETTVAVPPEAQNFDQVKQGDRFKVRYYEQVAVSVTRNGGAAEPASAATTVQLASPKGGTPGGVAATTLSASRTVETVDAASRQITLKDHKGESKTLKVGKDVNLDAVQPGDKVDVTYTQALATRLITTQEPMAEPAPAKE